MVVYAALSNTLLITSRSSNRPEVVYILKLSCPVLISILSNTFARIDQVGLAGLRPVLY
jgi:hypothetical protein